MALMLELALCSQVNEQEPPRKISAAAPYTPYYPIPRGNSILGVIYGVLLWADMNAATPLGARGCSVTAVAAQAALAPVVPPATTKRAPCIHILPQV